MTGGNEKYFDFYQSDIHDQYQGYFLFFDIIYIF